MKTQDAAGKTSRNNGVLFRMLPLAVLGALSLNHGAHAEGPPIPSAPAAEKAPTAAAAGSGLENTYGEMDATARRLAGNIGMPADRCELALSRLHTALKNGKIAAFAPSVGINGIFAYQMGEGGFLVKVRKGKGVAHILGDGRDVPLQFKSVTFGAQIGGGSEWGFGVVLGLRAPGTFGGEYKGDTRGATAGEESISITKLVKKDAAPLTPAYHEVYMAGVAAGLSAGAAIGNLTITPTVL